MKKLVVSVISLFSAVALFAGFAEDCQKVEAWIEKTYPANSPSRRLQNNRLRLIRRSTDSEVQKCEKLRQQFPAAFGMAWKAELQAAKAQGITFSEDNKTLIKCPENVTTVVIPSCVTRIGDGAFDCCRNLTSITIPDGVTRIGDGAFDGCRNLTSITIPDGVTRIGHRAFSGCRSLTSITIPDSVTSIGMFAFFDCSSLTSITIPANCKVDNSAFPSNCRVIRR